MENIPASQPPVHDVGNALGAKAHRPPARFVPHPFAWHQEIELTIQALTNLGVGLGRVDGWVVMVPFSLPGEKVRARVFRNHKNYSEADLLEVLEASPARVKPQCPLYGTCGGCQYQHLSHEEQLRWKRQQVQELLERLGGIKIEVDPTVASPREYAYRSKLTPHFARPKEDAAPVIGFLQQGCRHRLVDVAACPIATDAINAALPAERARVTAEAGKRQRGATLLLRDCGGTVITNPQATATETIGNLTFRFTAGEFFQNNPFILPKLVDYVVGQAHRPGIRFLVDAYCGVGVFAIAASTRFESCTGVEISRNAVAQAQGNAVLNGVTNCRFVAGSAESIFVDVPGTGEESAVILDPSRSGCDGVFLNQLLAFRPKRIVYVSCAPDTQARDLRILVEGGYAVESVRPFDLFPQTRHIESVATLVLPG